MAPREFGIPGQFLRQRVLRLAVLWVTPVFLVAIVLILITLMNRSALIGLAIVCAGPVAFLTLRKWDRAANRAVDPWLTGLQGEKDVAATLRTALTEDCSLVNDLDLGCGNVDHVVVAPSGVFAIETKADLAKVETKGDHLFVNGFDRERDLRQAYREAKQVTEFLSLVSSGRKHFVTPLLVFTRANVFAYGKCRGVYVLGLDRLPGFVSYGRERIDRADREKITRALRTRATRPEGRREEPD